jgi:hypothetical protein
MSSFEHLILTRFNLRDPRFRRDRDGRPTDTDQWFVHRLGLFEQFCLPSIVAQSTRRFRWFVMFDEETPPVFRSQVETLFAACPSHFIALFTTTDRYRADVLAHVAADARYLITTRLDNDDAFHHRAIETIQQHFDGQDLGFINLIEGYVLQDGRVRLRREPSNPFISLVERRTADGFRTVYCGNHSHLSNLARIQQVETGEPLWLRVIHERNLLNGRKRATWLKRLASTSHATAREVLLSFGLNRRNYRPFDDVRPMFGLNRAA